MNFGDFFRLPTLLRYYVFTFFRMFSICFGWLYWLLVCVWLTLAFCFINQSMNERTNAWMNAGFFKGKFTTAQISFPSPFPLSPPFSSLLFSSLPFLPLPFPPSPGSPPPFSGVRGYHLRKIFGIRDARRLVLEHFGHKNQHRYKPGF